MKREFEFRLYLNKKGKSKAYVDKRIIYCKNIEKAFGGKDIDDIRNNKVIERVFNPNLQCEKRERRIKGWKTAVAMARYKPEI
jgi:hypothetical protein